MKKIVLGENKVRLNYIHNVFDKNYEGRVVAHLTFENGDNEVVKNRKPLDKENDNVQEYLNNIIEDCEVDITFANKKAVDDMIKYLTRMRDNTDWDWRKE